MGSSLNYTNIRQRLNREREREVEISENRLVRVFDL